MDKIDRVEINIEDRAKHVLLIQCLNDKLANRFVFVSLDKQDFGKLFNIQIVNITSIEEDAEGLCIWWKKWSVLEGKAITNSNYFKEFLSY